MATGRKSIISFRQRKIRGSLDIQGFQFAESKYEYQSISHSLFYKAFRVFHSIAKAVGRLILKIGIIAVVA